MSHRWEANPLSLAGGVYADTGHGATPWTGMPVKVSTAAGASITSEGDYEWGIPVLVGDNAVPTGDLYDVYERSFSFDGVSGVAVTPGNALQTVGASGKGLTIAVWFRLRAVFSAVNQGHNTLFAISNAGGTTIKVVISAGRPTPRLSKPRLLILITTRNNGNDGSDFVSDYGASETDKAGGTQASRFSAKPNGGAVVFMTSVLNVAWQHVALTFDGTGKLSSVFWNGRKQVTNFTAIALPQGLPFGPIGMASIGYGGVRTGFERGTHVYTGKLAVNTWSNLVALQGEVSDVQVTCSVLA